MSVLCREKTSGKKGIVTPTEQLWCFPTCQLHVPNYISINLKRTLPAIAEERVLLKGSTLWRRVQVINIAVFNSTLYYKWFQVMPAYIG